MSGYEDHADRPLFGETTPRDRVVNLIVGALTGLVVIVTLVGAFAFRPPPWGVNVFFAICITLILLSHLVLIYWYRQGDLEPKFRTMIYYNAFSIILLCICANLYIYQAFPSFMKWTKES